MKRAAGQQLSYQPPTRYRTTEDVASSSQGTHSTSAQTDGTAFFNQLPQDVIERILEQLGSPSHAWMFAGVNKHALCSSKRMRLAMDAHFQVTSLRLVSEGIDCAPKLQGVQRRLFSEALDAFGGAGPYLRASLQKELISNLDMALGDPDLWGRAFDELLASIPVHPPGHPEFEPCFKSVRALAEHVKKLADNEKSRHYFKLMNRPGLWTAEVADRLARGRAAETMLSQGLPAGAEIVSGQIGDLVGRLLYRDADTAFRYVELAVNSLPPPETVHGSQALVKIVQAVTSLQKHPAAEKCSTLAWNAVCPSPGTDLGKLIEGHLSCLISLMPHAPEDLQSGLFLIACDKFTAGAPWWTARLLDVCGRLLKSRAPQVPEAWSDAYIRGIQAVRTSAQYTTDAWRSIAASVGHLPKKSRQKLVTNLIEDYWKDTQGFTKEFRDKAIDCLVGMVPQLHTNAQKRALACKLAAKKFDGVDFPALVGHLPPDLRKAFFDELTSEKKHVTTLGRCVGLLTVDERTKWVESTLLTSALASAKSTANGKALLGQDLGLDWLLLFHGIARGYSIIPRGGRDSQMVAHLFFLIEPMHEDFMDARDLARAEINVNAKSVILGWVFRSLFALTGCLHMLDGQMQLDASSKFLDTYRAAVQIQGEKSAELFIEMLVLNCSRWHSSANRADAASRIIDLMGGDSALLENTALHVGLQFVVAHLRVDDQARLMPKLLELEKMVKAKFGQYRLYA